MKTIAQWNEEKWLEHWRECSLCASTSGPLYPYPAESLCGDGRDLYERFARMQPCAITGCSTIFDAWQQEVEKMRASTAAPK